MGGDRRAEYLVRAPVRGDAGAPSEWPSVSFCIPTRNRRSKLETCLRFLRRLRYGGEIEIVVVDNGSVDGSATVAKRYADMVVRHDGTLGAVRQHSIDLSRGEILGLIDDDLYIEDPHWLTGAVRSLTSSPQISTLWPALVPPVGSGLASRCFFDLNRAIFEDRMANGRGVFGGGNSLFKRSAVLEVGGFDPTVGFGEDMILASRLRDAGYQVCYYDRPVVHDSMESLREIYRKQRWGASAVATHGLQLMQQSRSRLIYEQYGVGTKAMLQGLARGHWSWLAYPTVVLVKSLAYGMVVLGT